MQGCTCRDVHAGMYMQGCTSRDVQAGCTCNQGCTCRDVHAAADCIECDVKTWLYSTIHCTHIIHTPSLRMNYKYVFIYVQYIYLKA